MKRLRKRGELKLEGKFAVLKEDAAWEAFCDGLAAVDWVTFIQPPPTQASSADQVIRYCSRYLTGGPISDGRILAADRREVTFLTREGKRTGGERAQVPVTLSCREFIRRWCLHIQPEQLTKTRCFGGWCNQRRAAYLRQCRELWGDPAAAAAVAVESRVSDSEAASFSGEAPGQAAELRCPVCESSAMRLIRTTAKPSWPQVLHHLDPRCPTWYAETGRQEQRRYLLETYGVDYEDWLLETRLESAMEVAAAPPPIQLCLPGLFPVRDFQLESF